MATRAISYVRFSTPDQLKGDSLRRQLTISARYAADHNLELDDTLRDLGVSAFRGRNRNQGALGRLVEMVRSDQIEPGTYLLVESLDRLSRETVLEALELFIALIRAGIVIVTLSDGQVYSKGSIGDDWSKLLISLTIMSRAHEESLTKSRRLASAWANKRQLAAVRRVTKRCPEWLDANAEGGFTPIEPRVAVVRRIFDEAVSGLGKRAIAKRLNSDGIPAFRGKNGWHCSAVQKLLANEAVLGIFRPHTRIEGKRVPAGDPISGYYPKIIGDQIFWRARSAVESRARFAGRKGKTFSNLFSGLAVCLHCHARMVFINKGKPPKGGRYLVCGRARRGLCENKRQYRYEELERGILENISELDFDASSGVTSRHSNIDANLEGLVAQAVTLKKKQSALLDAFENDSIEAVADRIRVLDRAINTNAAEQQRLQAKLNEVLAQPTPTEHVDAVGRLRNTLASIEGDDDVFTMRSRIASELRSIIETILFSSNSVDVALLGYIRVYRFEGGKLTHVYPVWKMHKLKPTDSVISALAPEPNKARRLHKLISATGG